MKGIALTTIAYFIIALFTLIIIFSIITGKISPSVQKAYCSLLRGLKSVLPLPPHMRTSLPMYCQQDGRPIIETIEIVTKDPERISLEIASYAIACWEKIGKIDVSQDTICYELILKNVEEEVTEGMVLEKVTEGGYIDLLIWNAGIIDSPKSIGISYDSGIKKIEVS